MSLSPGQGVQRQVKGRLQRTPLCSTLTDMSDNSTRSLVRKNRMHLGHRIWIGSTKVCNGWGAGWVLSVSWTIPVGKLERFCWCGLYSGWCLCGRRGTACPCQLPYNSKSVPSLELHLPVAYKELLILTVNCLALCLLLSKISFTALFKQVSESCCFDYTNYNSYL